ncbi:hypothetical protein Tco_0610308 [Tanacetum coccineum]
MATLPTAALPVFNMASHRSDEIRYDVYFGGCFFICPLDYQKGKILYLRLPRSKRLSYKEMNDLLLDKTKEEIWKLFYCKPKCTLEKCLTIVENDRDIENFFELVNLQGALDVYVCHVPQPILVDYYFKNLCVVFESDDEVTSIYKGNEKGKGLLDDFEAVGNGKDTVDGDDAKDELISTKGDGEQNEGSSSSSNFH